uniref:KH domain-containing protein n=1 Tax=Cyanothece sp. (strain PCC 7425 / ATCC 29141) TaxID=395961 RepID=B8HKC6_CYAP4
MPELLSPESSQSQPAVPDYAALLRFLVEPFLESPAALKVDCEFHPARSRIWIRLAFESSDKGRVFGRGGRTIQAIRTVVEAAAQAVGHTVYLDIYGEREKSDSAKREMPRGRSSDNQRPTMRR